MKKCIPWAGALGVALLAFSSGAPRAAEVVTVGSKAFPESWILGEAAASLARQSGPAVHRANMGGTDILFDALRAGAVDVYPEYSGTISEVILKSSGRPGIRELRRALAPMGIGISEPLGFNDGYALAVSADAARRLGLRRISDLRSHPGIRLGLSHEFLGRRDGYPGLAAHYGLRLTDVRGIQHELAYQALASGKIDGLDVYTTDAEIGRQQLVTLEDDLGFFPRYDAVLLYRLDLAHRRPDALAAMRRLEGRVNEARMIAANVRVVLEKQPYARAANELLAGSLPGAKGVANASASPWASVLPNTLRHLFLVSVSLLGAILVGIPLGVAASRSRALGAVTLTGIGLLQTIPSLALLAFLIPLLGIGAAPALAALFLYSLLPIVRNTCVGLTTIPPELLEASEAIGLSAAARLSRVELPLASPSIMAGIKTSAVINVGTATLAALIGAGGLGEPILTGIQLRQPSTILAGALPAAALALLVQGAFDLLERWVVPVGLRRAARAREALGGGPERT